MPSSDDHLGRSNSSAARTPTRAPTYGAVKAELHGFGDGLRAQLAERDVHVMEVLPPTTDTPMNAHARAKKLDPAVVASAVVQGVERRRTHVYPGRSRMLPLLLRVAPGHGAARRLRAVSGGAPPGGVRWRRRAAPR